MKRTEVELFITALRALSELGRSLQERGPLPGRLHAALDALHGMTAGMLGASAPSAAPLPLLHAVPSECSRPIAASTDAEAAAVLLAQIAGGAR